MSIKFVNGDLFDNDYNLDIVAHGCNSLGVMGAGIAVEFKRRYPASFRAYRNEWEYIGLPPGKCLLHEEKGVTTACLITQKILGLATIPALAVSFNDLLHQSVGRRVGLPRICAGLGNLKWSEVKKTLREVESWHEYADVVVLENYVKRERG